MGLHDVGDPMTAVTRPRGPLPARVYWLRRGILLAVVLALVVGAVSLLGTFTGPPSGGETAAPAADSSPQQQDRPTAKATAKESASAKAPVRRAATNPRQAQEGGICRPEDVSVQPAVKKVRGGSATTLTLKLTGAVRSCSFTVSSATMVARITSGSDRIWSSQDCPDAIPAQDLMVRSDRPTKVLLTWSGRRSEEECPKGTAWADTGYYHLTAAVLGGQPGDRQFRIVTPPRRIVVKTETAKPKPEKKKSSRR